MIDLHCHSTASDGSATPRELIALASQENINAIALTDHDTMAGLQEFQAAGREYNLTAIPGIELSARDENRNEFHFVGLFIDSTTKTLQKFCLGVQQLRQERNLKILELLPSLNYPLTLSEVQAECPGGVIGRPHIAAALVRKGYFRDSKQVFKKLLGRGCPGYISRQVPTPTECITAIRQAGGIAIWAHPFSRSNLTNRHCRTLAQALKKIGLDGIEAYYPMHTSEQVKEVCKIAAEYKLLLSGGSDFHGDHFPNLKIGVAYGNLNVPDNLLPLLQDRARSYAIA